MPEYRRGSDSRIDEILKNQKQHMIDFHSNLIPGEAAKLIEEHKAMVPAIDRILVILDGEPVVNASGETRRVGGIASDVADLKKDSNGGSRLSMETRDKVVVGLIASIGPIVLMIGAVIAAARGVTP